MNPRFFADASCRPLALAKALSVGNAVAICRNMLNILSFLIGLATLILMIPAVLPIVGILNWLLVPIALAGAFIGMLSSRNGGRNFCLIVAAFGALRLFAGGGLI